MQLGFDERQLVTAVMLTKMSKELQGYYVLVYLFIYYTRGTSGEERILFLVKEKSIQF